MAKEFDKNKIQKPGKEIKTCVRIVNSLVKDDRIIRYFLFSEQLGGRDQTRGTTTKLGATKFHPSGYYGILI